MDETNRPIAVAETKGFEDVVDDVMSEDELEAFKFYIACNPERGEIIQGTGGVRKIGWGLNNRGKKSGARVIYYYMNPDYPIYLLTTYSKSQKASLTSSQKQLMKKLVTQIKDSR